MSILHDCSVVSYSQLPPLLAAPCVAGLLEAGTRLPAVAQSRAVIPFEPIHHEPPFRSALLELLTFRCRTRAERQREREEFIAASLDQLRRLDEETRRRLSL